jgi:hypothetical protein
MKNTVQFGENLATELPQIFTRWSRQPQLISAEACAKIEKCYMEILKELSFNKKIEY